MDIDVQVTGRGEVGPKLSEYARAKVTRTARLAWGAVLFARLKLLYEPDPARERPALAAVEMDVDGQIVRAHAVGHDLQEAIDLMVDNLQDEFEHARERRLQRRHRGPGASEPHEWRRGDAPTMRPPYFGRPPELREVVRHASFASEPLTVEEAVEEMDRLAYDFHLFTCRDTGAATVVSRRDDGRVDVATVGPVPPLADWMVLDRTPVTTLTDDDACARLDATGQAWLLYVPADGGGAAVIYHRYDGHYGLVELSGIAPQPA